MFSCKKESRLKNEITIIDIDVTVERFDVLFANASPNDLPELKQSFPFMFSKRYSDSLWIERMHDTLQRQLFNEVDKQFRNFNDIENEVQAVCQHLNYYFPETNVPRVITTTSYVDYRNQVIVTDTIALISLDTYLGSDHYFYDGIQKYLKQNFNQEQIVVDLANEYAKKLIFQAEKRTLLDERGENGKQLFV